MRYLVFLMIIGITLCVTTVFAQRPYSDYSFEELEVKKKEAAVATNYRRAAKFKEAIEFKNKIQEAIEEKERKKAKALEDQLRLVFSAIEIEDFNKKYIQTDSEGYQFYYVLTIYKKGEIDWVSKEGSVMKTPWNGLPFTGRWHFKNYPDSVIITQEGKDKEVAVSINNIANISFKKADRMDGWDWAYVFVSSQLGVGGGISAIFYAIDALSEYEDVYFMSSKKNEAKLTLVKETKTQKADREAKN